MSQEVVEVVYGNLHKYEVVRDKGLVFETKFYVRRDGKSFKGPYSSLASAVEAAKQAG